MRATATHARDGNDACAPRLLRLRTRLRRRPPCPGPAPLSVSAARPAPGAMPLYEGLGSGGEKTAVVLDLGEAFTK